MPGPFLQLIARGDETAVAACLDEYGGMVWGLAERYLKGFGEDLEDAVQEVFVEVWRSAARFDPAMGSEPAFIATIAHRRLIDRQRRVQARRAVQLEDDRIIESKAVVKDGSALRDDVAAAARAFESLDSDEKQVLWYALYQGLSHERIAKAINVPLGTVKTRIRRGLSRLREALSTHAGKEVAS
ncbi:MAG: sigma-70 family RNA polymerase sigma factor [Planctomycetes bacterium]|nr:sigma-70 family RNA polymerase sigma factor [Planctomycetota bacterium]